MARASIAGVACGLLLAVPGTAAAGAPNYDCFVHGGRVTIDQWSGVVAVSGFAGERAAWGLTGEIDQNGPTLDLTATLRGTPWAIAVRGYGSSMTAAEPGATLAGHCALMPGFFIVRRADAGGFALRAGPSAHARSMLRIPVGSPVWQDSRRTPSGHWLPVRTVVARSGKVRALEGWLRQRRAPISRDIAGSPDY